MLGHRPLCIALVTLVAGGCATMRRGGSSAADPLDEPALVTLAGPRNAGAWGWLGGLVSVDRDGDRHPTLWARDGELLPVQFDEQRSEGSRPLIYRRQDGALVTVTWTEPALAINGVPTTLIIDGEAGWRFLEAASDATLAALRLVDFPRQAAAPAPDQLALLARLAAVNPQVGLSFDGEEGVREVTSRFHPRLLMLGDGPPLAATDPLLTSMDRVESLLVRARPATDFAFLAALPALRRLLLADADDNGTAATFPGHRLGGLQQLVVAGDIKGARDLGLVRGLDGLRDLQVFGGTGVLHADAVTALPRLSTLLVNVAALDAAPLAAGRHLRRLGGVRGDQLPALVAANPRLEAIEMYDKENVGDLAPLVNLPRLTALVLPDTALDEQQLAALARLTSLRLLVIGKDTFHDAAEAVAALRRALPRCAIVPGGVCLGSGFLLLLPVLLALGALARGRRRDPGAAATARAV